LIAIKERARCKTRLAEVLPPLARIELVRSMPATVLAAAECAQTVHQIRVLSPEGLGDGDLAVHVERSWWLAQGAQAADALVA
jgi:2-phospho-L-lactate guanylyltransferase (CobY/MobA/RfbA family)